MKPDIEDVKPLENFDAASFAGWLRRGFEDIHNKERRLTAFAPLNYFVRRHGDLTGELKNIYEVLSVQEQFRLGIAIALSGLPPTHRSVHIVRALLHLAGRVHATEIMSKAVQQVGNGFFGMSGNNEGRELFALTLDIVAGMSPAHGVGDTVRRLVASRFFDSGYVPRAFIALCRSEPEEFPNHLKLLRSHFAELHKMAGTEDAFITAHRFVQYVDLVVIRRNLWRLHLCAKPYIDPLDTDNWLAQALFIGENAPLELDKDGDDFVISRQEQERIQPTWKIRFPKEWQMWDHVDDVRKFLNHCLRNNRKLVVREVKRTISHSRSFQPCQKLCKEYEALVTLGIPLYLPMQRHEAIQRRELVQ